MVNLSIINLILFIESVKLSEFSSDVKEHKPMTYQSFSVELPLIRVFNGRICCIVIVTPELLHSHVKLLSFSNVFVNLSLFNGFTFKNLEVLARSFLD